jgi:hypothetical protein
VLYRGVRERDLRGHISHEAASPDAPAGAGAESEAPSEPEGAEEAAVDPADPAEADEEDRDVLVARAVEVLKSWTYFDRLSERKARADPSAAAQSEGGARPE